MNTLLLGKQLTCGCIVNVHCHTDYSKTGQEVFVIDKIFEIYTPNNTSPYKSIQHKNDDSYPLNKSLTHSLNAGTHLRIQHFKDIFLNRLEQLLQEYGITKIYTPITTPYRGTSTATPVTATGHFVGSRYIKITHELGLKSQCCLTLGPVYEIGYVMRDRYATQLQLNEFLTLEVVLPKDFSFTLQDFYIKTFSAAKEIAHELHLSYAQEFEEVEVIDALKWYLDSHKQFDEESFRVYCSRILTVKKHAIITHLPIDSPLAIASEYGPALETKWIYCGHGIGHGYYDEYRYDYLLKEFTSQQEQLHHRGINADLPIDYLRICEHAELPTFSFNLGIDRFIKFLFPHDI